MLSQTIYLKTIKSAAVQNDKEDLEEFNKETDPFVTTFAMEKSTSIPFSRENTHPTEFDDFINKIQNTKNTFLEKYKFCYIFSILERRVLSILRPPIWVLS